MQPLTGKYQGLAEEALSVTSDKAVKVVGESTGNVALAFKQHWLDYGHVPIYCMLAC